MNPRSDAVILRCADATVRLSPGNGGRISGLTVAGHDLLVDGDEYGSFPMVPWCGRLRDGVLRHAGREYEFPCDAPPHALHGLGWTAGWTAAALTDTAAELSFDLGAPWPFGGTVTQRIAIDAHGLDLELTISPAAVDFPAQAGWHPWFRRTLSAGDPPLRLDFTPAWQELRGDDYLPTGDRVPPRPGPWDDCFGMPDGVDATLTWPGRLQLRITSPVRWIVVYDQLPQGICVEPQSGPPDGLNTTPQIVTQDAPLRVRSRWDWRLLG
ncbi:aldose epimerase family protein [Nocardia stercoris]|uniref:Aldose 1-epimerase n=1 Tax=Nocardia stercoris TaxID=2483361 RepID=A0A3M2L9R5_9NOCA|nr:aldose 1-epimerase [Nocardia stercoris]RMI34154.1 aldose 1-epimerase [Nocardia stercoris]